ncbi:hypothetical protein E2C01_057366 [Portunus trituberculatus]|uniref:Uncharacterized protein n=1 Tax=Portunus trituberculatus TaxID=210409 RepID=A0A5B7GT94_PORTR|nr:hypothetical protein [Portunus trituberculatus]
MLVEYYPWVHSDGLESRRLGLSFTVDKSHFIMGNLVLKCKATVATVTREEDATISEGEQVILEQREKLVYDSHTNASLTEKRTQRKGEVRRGGEGRGGQEGNSSSRSSRIH